MGEKEYDLIIIGGGAAGLTAAIYASRRALKTLVISKEIGGQASSAFQIENYPGRELIGGSELMNDFKKQAEKFGTEFILEEVKEIKNQGNNFLLKTSQQQYFSRSLILAFGLTPRDLGVTGEKEFKNKGVSYCATCDAPLYKNKSVVVVGGGNSALDAAELLSKIANKVYLILRGDSFTGEKILQERVKEKKNIEILFNTEIEEIKGEKTVSAIKLKNNQTQKEKELACEGVFVEIGYITKTNIVEGLVELNERRQIKIDHDCETSYPGIFAAGDITDITYRQVIISAGEGAKAALQAYKYLQKAGKTIGVDWGRVKKQG